LKRKIFWIKKEKVKKIVVQRFKKMKKKEKRKKKKEKRKEKKSLSFCIETKKFQLDKLCTFRRSRKALPE